MAQLPFKIFLVPTWLRVLDIGLKIAQDQTCGNESVPTSFPGSVRSSAIKRLQLWTNFVRSRSISSKITSGPGDEVGECARLKI